LFNKKIKGEKMLRNSMVFLALMTACGADNTVEQAPVSAGPTTTEAGAVEITDPETSEVVPTVEDASETVDPVTATTGPTEPTDQTTTR
jgi:hypothetical protein